MIDLGRTIEQIFVPGKGILAADESVHTADARLALYGIPGGADMRRRDRDLFLAAPGIEHYLSGVILFDETLRQSTNAGTPFAEHLSAHGILPGIKVDKGTEPFPDSPEEFITKGLLGLPERLAAYHDQFGTVFTKWRAVVRIKGDTLPSRQALVENAKRLADYAWLVQEAGMVPFIEPEVLLEGMHSRLRAREVLVETLTTVVAALGDRSVGLDGVVIKTAMALSGKESGKTDTPEEVAEDTVGALLAAVPKQLGGIVFLSGGQTPDQATANLAAVVALAREKHAPWPMTFSYARALQEEALNIWAGKDERVPAARTAFLDRLAKVSAALAG